MCQKLLASEEIVGFALFIAEINTPATGARELDKAGPGLPPADRLCKTTVEHLLAGTTFLLPPCVFHRGIIIAWKNVGQPVGQTRPEQKCSCFYVLRKQNPHQRFLTLCDQTKGLGVTAVHWHNHNNTLQVCFYLWWQNVLSKSLGPGPKSFKSFHANYCSVIYCRKTTEYLRLVFGSECVCDLYNHIQTCRASTYRAPCWWHILLDGSTITTGASPVSAVWQTASSPSGLWADFWAKQCFLNVTML